MLFHRPLDGLFRRAGLQVKLLVQSVELEEVAMRFARWRTRPAITKPFEIVDPLLRAAGKVLALGNVFGQLARAGRIGAPSLNAVLVSCMWPALSAAQQFAIRKAKMKYKTEA